VEKPIKVIIKVTVHLLGSLMDYFLLHSALPFVSWVLVYGRGPNKVAAGTIAGVI
jgi:hypothetical protein